MNLGEPLLGLFYSPYRWITGEAWRRPFHEAPRRILVVRLDTAGDVLLSEPAVAALHQRFPWARLDVVTSPGGKAVLQGNPLIDHFILYEAPWHAARRGRRMRLMAEVRSLWRLVRHLRRQGYDLAVELRGDVRDIAVAVASGARLKAGSSRRGGRSLLDYDAGALGGVHSLQIALSIVAQIGAGTEPRPPRVYVGEKERATAGRLFSPLSPGGLLIAFHLGAGFPSKRLPIGSFQEAAQRLCRDGTQCLVVGGPEDRALAEEFARGLPFEVTDLAGKLSFLETAAVLERCHLFIGNDSAPMHVAAAVGTPVVALFGPSDPGQFHPWGAPCRIVELPLPCRPCDLVHCRPGNHPCMGNIAVGDIVAAAEELLRWSRKALPSRLMA